MLNLGTIFIKDKSGNETGCLVEVVTSSSQRFLIANFGDNTSIVELDYMPPQEHKALLKLPNWQNNF